MHQFAHRISRLNGMGPFPLDKTDMNTRRDSCLPLHDLRRALLLIIGTTVGMDRRLGLGIACPPWWRFWVSRLFFYLTACDTPQLTPMDVVLPYGHCRRKCRLSYDLVV
jgi:hypothetical protein